MVEKQIQFYFSKHPQIELDCGWSRKGSSNTERSLFMANNTHYSNMETDRFVTHIQCTHKPDLYSTALRIERRLAKGLVYVHVYFEYVDRADASYDVDDWCIAGIGFSEFESLVDYLINEFRCVELKEQKPLQSKPYFHTVDAVFTRQEGTI